MDIELWIEAAGRYLLPRLPGWEPAGDALVRAPVGWTACRVAPQPSDHEPGFYLLATVQLLALPDAETYGCGQRLGFWAAPATLAAYEPVMPEIVDAVTNTAVPFFDRYGTVEGYRERASGEELVYASLILGDRAGAERAAAGVERDAAGDDTGWVQEAAARVRAVMAAEPEAALAILAGYAAATAEELWLPVPAL